MSRLNIVKTKITNESSIVEVSKIGIHSSWKSTFESAEEDLEFVSKLVKKNEGKEGLCFPAKEHIFRAFKLTPLGKIKAVFIVPEAHCGTNYDSTPLADGLAFSVPQGSTIPKDLIALYNEIHRIIPDFVIPIHGDLSNWALQGILLLNLSLTSTAHKPDNYGEIWLGFIARVLESITKEQPKLPYILFGDKCKKITSLISRQSLVITTVNPGYTKKIIEDNVIQKLLEYWQKNNIESINWKL